MGFVVKSNVKDISVDDRAYDGYAVTPDDNNDLPNGPCRALYITGAGNVNVNLHSETTGSNTGTAVLTSLAAGQIVACKASRVLSTSTTATGILALY